MMLAIRKANISDAKVLAFLGSTTFIESHSKYINNDKEVKDFCNSTFKISKLKEELQDKNILFWLMFYDELPIGFAKVILNKTNAFIESEKVCQLDKIYILNDFLGMKLGSKLHTAIVQKMQELKFDTIWLVTYILNYKAIKFYESQQYIKAGFIDYIVANKGYKNHVLVKKINK